MDLVYVVEALGGERAETASELQKIANAASELRKIAKTTAPARSGLMENAVELHFPNGLPPESRAAVESALIQVVGGDWEESYRVHPPSFQLES